MDIKRIFKKYGLQNRTGASLQNAIVELIEELEKEIESEKVTKENKRGGSRPGAGRKRGAGLPEDGELDKLPPIWIDEQTLTFLRSRPEGISAFVREAIREKISEMKESSEWVEISVKLPNVGEHITGLTSVGKMNGVYVSGSLFRTSGGLYSFTKWKISTKQK